MMTWHGSLLLSRRAITASSRAPCGYGRAVAASPTAGPLEVGTDTGLDRTSWPRRRGVRVILATHDRPHRIRGATGVGAPWPLKSVPTQETCTMRSDS